MGTEGSGIDAGFKHSLRETKNSMRSWLHDSNHFARSTKHLLTALGKFQALGINFMSYSESIDTATPVGKMVFAMVAAVAEMERALIRERVQAEYRRKLRRAGVALPVSVA